MIKNIYKLNTKHWQHKVGTIGELATDADDILQCYEVIFKTPRGSVVLNPNLGWDVIQYLGKPLNLVESKMRPALMQAFIIQEPRAIPQDVKFSYGSSDDFASGHLTVEVTFMVVLTGEIKKGTFTL